MTNPCHRLDSLIGGDTNIVGGMRLGKNGFANDAS